MAKIDISRIKNLLINGRLSPTGHRFLIDLVERAENLPVVAKTAAYTLTAGDCFVECDATGGAFSITLPAVADVNIGKVYHIKKTDASVNAVTIDGSGAETIDDSATASLAAQYDSVSVINNGSEWWKI